MLEVTRMPPVPETTTDDPTTPHPTPLVPFRTAEEFATYWKRLARKTARQAGLSRHETDDFEAIFCARMWKEHGHRLAKLPFHPFSYWRTCARHDLQDFLRQCAKLIDV